MWTAVFILVFCVIVLNVMVYSQGKQITYLQKLCLSMSKELDCIETYLGFNRKEEEDDCEE